MLLKKEKDGMIDDNLGMVYNIGSEVTEQNGFSDMWVLGGERASEKVLKVESGRYSSRGERF